MSGVLSKTAIAHDTSERLFWPASSLLSHTSDLITELQAWPPY